MTIRKGGYDYPDPTLVKWPGLACIPLPTEWSMRQPGVATMRGPTSPPNAEDATSYDELWFGFAIGRTIPDPFRRLFQAIGTSWAPNEARDAVLGYGLVRHISRIHAGTFDRDAINAFLVTLAAFERTWKIAKGRTGLWATLLKRESTDPLNNWAALTAFQNPETYPRDDFGLMFLPPAQTSQPSQHENTAITLLYTNCLWLKHHDDPIKDPEFGYCLVIQSILFCIQIFAYFFGYSHD